MYLREQVKEIRVARPKPVVIPDPDEAPVVEVDVPTSVPVTATMDEVEVPVRVDS